MKRAKSADPTFNALQELIYQYKRYEKRVPESHLRSFEGYIEFLIGEGWSFDYGD